MSQRRRRIRFTLRMVAFIAMLALCAGVSYTQGIVGDIAYLTYQNTSPPLTSTTNDVMLALAHSRFLTIEAITLILSNHARAPIYLPITSDFLPANGEYAHATDEYVHATGVGNQCLAFETAVQSAQGWQSLGRGCWSVVCSGGAVPPIPHPALLIIAPGESVAFALYDYQSSYPARWASGVYQFSALYTLTPFLPPRYWGQPLAIPNGVTLSIAPVTLTGAWWYAQYHHSLPACPYAA